MRTHAFCYSPRRHEGHEGGLLDFEIESRELIGAAIAVHKALGPGLLESAYTACLVAELEDRGVAFQREVRIPLLYKGRKVKVSYRADLIVADSILVEVKSIQRIEPIHRAQFLTYLKLTKLHIDFLMNLNSPVMHKGIERMVL